MFNHPKKLLISSAIAFIVFSVSAKAMYIPEHLEQFKKTGVCVNCDLSGAALEFRTFNNATLTGALLVKASLYSSRFYTADFSGA
jgi:uncharacterized protein YjbI with pentapeptide repeats